MVTKTSWIFVILGVPFFGLLLFAIFGLSPITKKKISEYLDNQKDFLAYENYELTHSILRANSKTMFDKNSIFKYGYKTGLRPVNKNNKVTILRTASDMIECIVKQVREAKHFIHIEYYIISKGLFLEIFCNELIKKSRQGIKVRFLYDFVGSLRKKDKKLIKLMKRNGIEVATFNVTINPIYGGKANYRCHRKMIIIDNEIAITGGSNIGDEYLSLGEYGHWNDINMMLKGPSVNTYSIIFATDWQSHTAKSISSQSKYSIIENANHYFKSSSFESSETLCQILESGPEHQERQIKSLLLKLITGARKRIWIATPYFLPSDDIMSALRTAAISGVQVHILLPGLPDDKKYIIAMNRHKQKELMNSGAVFFEYQSFMHSKMWLIDDETSIIGSFNLDIRSLYVNYEVATIIKDGKIAEQIESTFDNDFKNSIRVEPETYKERGFIYNRIYIGFLSLFYPML